jgi:hypothetical protein
MASQISVGMSKCACEILRLSQDSFLFIVAPSPGHARMCFQSSSLLSQKQQSFRCDISQRCLIFKHQKLNSIFVIVGCLAEGILLKAILNGDHAISFQVHSFHSSFSVRYFLSDG